LLRNTDNPAEGAVSNEYPNRGGAYFDCIAYRAYPHVDGSTVVSRTPALVYNRNSDRSAKGIVSLRDGFQTVLAQRGYNGTTSPQKEFIISETNIPRKSFDEAASFGSETAQRNYIPKAYINAKIANIRQLHIYALAENKPESESVDEFEVMGLYRNMSNKSVQGVQANESGVALKTTSDLLHNATHDAAVSAKLAPPPFVRAEAFKKPDGQYVFALWAETQADLNEEAGAVYSFPAAVKISNALRHRWNASLTKLVVETDFAAILLDGSPLFITASLATQVDTPAAPVVAAVGKPVLCPGQTVMLKATGLCSGCTVLWSNGQTGDSISVNLVGAYTAVATNPAGVSSPSSNAVSIAADVRPATPSVTPAGPVVLCPGQKTILTATNACADCTVRWSNGQTGPTLEIEQTGMFNAVAQSAVCRLNSTVSNDVLVVLAAAPLPPNIVANGPVAVCQGDSVTLRARNICSGCKVIWSDGQSGTSVRVKASGSYTATVQSGACNLSSTASNAIVVTVTPPPPAPIIVASGGGILCQGDSIILRAANVCEGCSLEWSNGQPGASATIKQAGVFTVTVQSNDQCKLKNTAAPAAVTAAQTPAMPTIAAGGPVTLCPGEKVTLTAGNVCQGCTVLWSNGQSGPDIQADKSGFYSATVLSAFCNLSSPASDPIIVGVASTPLPASIVADGPVAFCSGDSVVLRARNVCSGCTVVWSDGRSGASIKVGASGAYSATVRSSICDLSSPVSNTIDVAVSPLPVKPVISAGGPTALCPGEKVTLTASNICVGCTFSWSNGQTTPSIEVGQSAYYSAKTQVSGCPQIAQSDSILVAVAAPPLAPNVTAGGPTDVCPGENVLLRARNVCSGCTVRWSDDQTGSNIFVTKSGIYTAVVQSPVCGLSSAASTAVTVNVTAPPAAPLVKAEGGTVLCTGEKVVLRAENACNGCTVRWSNGETGPVLEVGEVGSYSATIQDPKCKLVSAVSNTIEVTRAPAPQAAVVSADGPTTLCPGDTLTLNAAGACAGCTVLWSNGARGTSLDVTEAGFYSARVQSTACNLSGPISNFIEVKIAQIPAVATAAADGPTVLCAGGAAILNATNVCAGCTVQWSDGQIGESIVVDAAGVYTATLLLGQCELQSAPSAPVSVNVNPLPSEPKIEINGLSNICEGQTTVLTAIEICTGCSVKWSNGSTAKSLTVNKPGIYTLVARNYCGQSKAASVTVPERLFVPALQLADTCKLTAETGSNYRWYLNDLEILEAAGQQSWTAKTAGVYKVRLTGPDGCSGLSAGVGANPCAQLIDPESESRGRQDAGDLARVEAFPNPTDALVYWRVQSELPIAVKVEVFGLDGRLLWQSVQSDALAEHLIYGDVSGWTPGVYLYRVWTGERAVWGKLAVGK
jgi:hypothetical protein